MTNSQNKKNEQQNNLRTTLTEQWKKGELKSGYYYIVTKYIEFPNRIDFYNSSAAAWSYHSSIFIEEVLAPVPSYEKHQEEQKSLKVLAEAYCKEKEENQQLKELLKKCKVAFKIYANEDETCGLEEENKYAKHLLTKIDEVLK